MHKLSCSDFGHNCDFKVKSQSGLLVIDSFGKHLQEKHGIKYPKKALLELLHKDKINENEMIQLNKIESSNEISERSRLEKWRPGKKNFA